MGSKRRCRTIARRRRANRTEGRVGEAEEQVFGKARPVDCVHERLANGLVRERSLAGVEERAERQASGVADDGGELAVIGEAAHIQGRHEFRT